MENNETFDLAIIGGGIVGAATFYKLQLRNPDLKLILIEKEDKLADHQTGHNSGVIHSGLYYKPGSLKAKNCVQGRHELVAFAKKYNVAHDVCGKVVVATQASELPFMEKIYSNGEANGTEGLERITAEQVKEIEPFVESIGGLYVPCTGIIDFVGATKKMVEVALGMQPKSKLVLGQEVIDINKSGGLKMVITEKAVYKAKKLIFCGGLQADRLAKKDQVKLKEKVGKCSIRAVILKENDSSIKFFTKCGYELSGVSQNSLVYDKSLV